MHSASHNARRSGTRRRTRLAALLSIVALAGLFSTTVNGTTAQAQETDENGYPTWAAVEAARGNEAAKEQQIKEIKALISNLEDQAAAAQDHAREMTTAAAVAQDAFNEARGNAMYLEEQAAKAAEAAEESKKQAAAMTGEIARTGGTGNMSVELFANPGEADDYLYRLGMMDRVSGTLSVSYEQAQKDANTALALKDQAKVASDKRDELYQEAQQAADDAMAAQQAAEQAVTEEMDHRGELEAQLSVLEEDRAATEADYQAGVEYRAELERKERERREREEREAREREQNNNPGTGTYTPPPTSDPPVTNSGWTRPSSGWITSHFGMRSDPLGQWGYVLHDGTDFSAGCGAPIRAAAAGTISQIGVDGYGANFVTINHGGGVSTSYYHNMYPTFRGWGEYVNAGDVIAYEGTTGWSTGCHLHFILQVNGMAQDSVPWLRARGVNV
ncbi:M23 family metallopeptidase [Agrococcus casei]|uniref:M23 family metallopeptidase n=1 Tax=Agrococcus casei TaxID=343512 RepID=UPI003F92210B